jgi:hypothetical protein
MRTVRQNNWAWARQRDIAYVRNRWLRRGCGCGRSLLDGKLSRFSDIEYVPLTNPIVVTPLEQIEMDVTIVIGIGAVTEHGRETSARTLP